MTSVGRLLAALALVLGAGPARASGPKQAGPQAPLAPTVSLPGAGSARPGGIAPVSLPDFNAALRGDLQTVFSLPPREAVMSLESVALAPAKDGIGASRQAAAQTVLAALAAPSFSRLRPSSEGHKAFAAVLGEESLTELKQEARRIQEASGEDEPLSDRLGQLRALLVPESRTAPESWADRARNLAGLFDKQAAAPVLEEPHIAPVHSADEAASLRNPQLSDQVLLTGLSQLDDEALEALGRRLDGLSPGTRAVLPMPEDTTFSLELEYLVNRQLDEASLDRYLGPGLALTQGEREKWRLDRSLPYEKWKAAHEPFNEAVEAAMPRGWRLQHESLIFTSNTMELKTANSGEVYHRNTAEDWEDLASGLRAVQARLPGGLFSVHAHVSRESALTPKRKHSYSEQSLAANAPRAAKAVLMFEPYWRALFGVGWPSRQQLADWRLEDFHEALIPGNVKRAREVMSTHGLFVNVSDRHPTIENRLVSGLVDGTRPNGRALDAATLKEDLWPAFALARLIWDVEQPLPLAALPLPPLDGKPTLKGIARFLDLAYAGDPMGKALALRSLLAWRRSGAAAAPDSARRQVKLAEVYAKAGLTAVYDLHKAHGGYDERLEHHLRANGGYLLRALARDLAERMLGRQEIAALFPGSLRELVIDAVAEHRRRTRQR